MPVPLVPGSGGLASRTCSDGNQRNRQLYPHSLNNLPKPEGFPHRQDQYGFNQGPLPAQSFHLCNELATLPVTFSLRGVTTDTATG